MDRISTKTIRDYSIRALAFILGSLTTYGVTSHIQTNAIEETKLETRRAEQRAAFYETWAAAEKFAFYMGRQDAKADFRKFVDKFPVDNPIAQIFRRKFSEEDELTTKAEAEAKLVLFGKQIQLTPPQVEAVRHFIESISEKPSNDLAAKAKLDAIEMARLGAKTVADSIVLPK